MLLLPLRVPRWVAGLLLGLFLLQFAVTGSAGRLVLSGAYLLLTLFALLRNRNLLVPTFRALQTQSGAGTE
jgi:cation:H+ antiporter